MSVLSADDLTKLRYYNHASDMYLAVLVPDDVFIATVTNNEDRGATAIEYENVTGDDSNAVPGHIVWFGTSAGAHDIGIARIKSVNAGTNVMTIEENDLDLTTGNHITVKKVFLPRVKLPSLDNSGSDVVFYKDGNAYVDENLNIPPMVVMGPPAAALIDSVSGVATIKFVDEYAWSPVGAELSIKTWNYDGGTSTGGSGTAADPYVVTYDTAGWYWVSLTITDANGATSTGWRPVYIYDVDNMPYTDFQSGQRRNSLLGTRQTFTVFGDADQNEFPDGAWVIRFNRDYYGGSESVLETRYPFRGNIKFVGYILSDSQRVADDRSSVSFEVVDIIIMLGMIPGFGQVLLDRASPANWTEMADLDVIRAICYILKWHSTVPNICDLRYNLALTTSELRMREQRWGKGSLLQQCNLILEQKGIFANLGATVQGCLEIRQDPALMKTSERDSTITTVAALAQTDFYSLDIQRQPRQQVQTIRVGGFSYDGATAIPLMGKAPGVPADALNEPRYDGLIFSATDGQTGVNRIAGDLAAKLNNIVPRVTLRCVGNWDVFDAGLQERVTFPLAAADNLRELVYTSDNDWIVREVIVDEDARGGFVRFVDLILELETDGVDGVTVTVPAPGDTDWPSPPLPADPSTPEPVPVVDPIVQLSQYVMCTNKGLFGIDFLSSSQLWQPINNGLDNANARIVYDFKLDPYKFQSQQRVWIATANGFYRMDYFPNGTWEQVISISDIETNCPRTYAGVPTNLTDDNIYQARIILSSEVEDRWAAVFCGSCTPSGPGQPSQSCWAAVFDDDVFTSAVELKASDRTFGFGDIRFAPHGSGADLWAISNYNYDNASDALAELWHTINAGTSWGTAVDSIDNNYRGIHTAIAIPYVDEDHDDSIIYWGRGGIVAGSTSQWRKSIDGGSSFNTIPSTGAGYFRIEVNDDAQRVFLGSEEMGTVASQYSLNGGAAWATLPLYTTALPSELDLGAAFANWSGNTLEVLMCGALSSYMVLFYTPSAAAWVNKTLNLESYGVTAIYECELCRIYT